jgi:hypothetical protein
MGERGALDLEAVDLLLLALDVEADHEFPEGTELLDVEEDACEQVCHFRKPITDEDGTGRINVES